MGLTVKLFDTADIGDDVTLCEVNHVFAEPDGDIRQNFRHAPTFGFPGVFIYRPGISFIHPGVDEVLNLVLNDFFSREDMHVLMGNVSVEFHDDLH